jgi:hypothetical protein
MCCLWLGHHLELEGWISLQQLQRIADRRSMRRMRERHAIEAGLP